MTKGDQITIHLHGHDQSVPGTIVEVLRDGYVRATINEGHGVVTINDEEHNLAVLDDQPRVLTCSPEMYELKGKRKK